MIRRVEREGGTVFQVYGRRNRKQGYVTTCESRKDARGAEEESRVTQRKIDRGELPPEVDDKRTLRTAVEEWLSPRSSSV